MSLAENRDSQDETGLNRFLLGGPSTGFLRLLLALLFLVLFMYLGRISFESIDTTAALESWKTSFDWVDRVPDFLLKFWAFLFSGQNFRYIYLPLAAFLGSLLLGACYIRDTYRLQRFRQALRYLLGAWFGIRYPRLTVSEGKLNIKPNEFNALKAIGGPALLVVKHGNLVLLEKLEGPHRICGPGSQFVSRLESVKEVISLQDQHGSIEAVTAKTKDGIPIVVRDIHFRYRLRSGRKSGEYVERTPDKPYPYSEKAILDMAYKRSVTSEGLVPWHTAVRQIVEGTITEYIYQHQVDHLTAPHFQEKDARTEIIQKANSKSTRERFRNIGAELLWFDMGHFDIAEERVKDQRLDTWGAKWIGDAAVIKSYGEAQRLIYQEVGRAEGQAEMLMSIVHALDQVALSDDSRQNVRNIILVRTAQILEALSDREQAPPPKAAPAEAPQLKRLPRPKKPE